MGKSNRLKYVSMGIVAAICVSGVQAGFALTDGAFPGAPGAAGGLTGVTGRALHGRVDISDEALPRKMGLPRIKRQPVETLQERLLFGIEAGRSS